MNVYEDNQAAARIISTGKFPKLRHVKRMHGISISWLNEALARDIYKLHDCHTKCQCADIFTKHFTSSCSWSHVMRLIGVVEDPELLKKIKDSLVHHKMSSKTKEKEAKKASCAVARVYTTGNDSAAGQLASAELFIGAGQPATNSLVVQEMPKPFSFQSAKMCNCCCFQRTSNQST